MKKEEPKAVKRKLDDEDNGDMSHLTDDGLDDFLVERANRLELCENPLFKANLTFLPYDGLSESLFEAVRDMILKEKLPDSTKVHLTLTSKEHSNGTVNSGFLSHVNMGFPSKSS